MKKKVFEHGIFGKTINIKIDKIVTNSLSRLDLLPIVLDKLGTFKRAKKCIFVEIFGAQTPGYGPDTPYNHNIFLQKYIFSPV